jgi:hypothetical protein
MIAEGASKRMRRPPVSASDPGALVYKDFENGALAAVPTDEAEPLDEAESFDDGMAEPEPFYEPFDDEQVDVLGRVIALERDFQRDERAKELAERDARIARLEGKVEALLALLGPAKSKRRRNV